MFELDPGFVLARVLVNRNYVTFRDIRRICEIIAGEFSVKGNFYYFDLAKGYWLDNLEREFPEKFQDDSDDGIIKRLEKFGVEFVERYFNRRISEEKIRSRIIEIISEYRYEIVKGKPACDGDKSADECCICGCNEKDRKNIFSGRRTLLNCPISLPENESRYREFRVEKICNSCLYDLHGMMRGIQRENGRKLRQIRRDHRD